MKLSVGMTGNASRVISDKDTAKAVGSGTVDVCATPILAAVMEAAAVACVRDALPEGETSVGISMTLSHKAPTVVGGTVTAIAVLSAIEGRRLTFRILATDAAGEVGEATHARFIVDEAVFTAKAADRAEIPG